MLKLKFVGFFIFDFSFSECAQRNMDKYNTLLLRAGFKQRSLIVLLGILTLSLHANSLVSEELYSRIEKQRYDGWYNNLAHPDWGAVDTHLVRRAPPSYSDGVYTMAGMHRPSTRILSRLFMRGTDGLSSMYNRTAFLAFFGQVIANEVVMASESGCPIEMHRIEIEKCDEMYDNECAGNKYIPFHRAKYDRSTGQSPNAPREQINQVTAWIDGSFIYSTSEAWLNAMRSFHNGTLLTEKGGKLPVKNTMRVPLFNNPVPRIMRMLSPERLFLLGDPRTNQNPAILSFAILFVRWHNTVAQRIKQKNSDWSDEDIFQRARHIVIASLQNVIMYEYLPAFLGSELPPYEGYKQDVHPGIGHVFQTAAFRFGHTLIPPGIYRRDSHCNFKKTPMGYPAIRLCSTWWDSSDFLSDTSVEEILMGLSSQISEREDPVLCADVRDKLFGPMEFTRRDLGALNIMRGRDNGLPDYNTAREAYGLKRQATWQDINPELFKKNPEILELLKTAYNNKLNDVDVYVGGMLESYGKPGELFSTVIKEQFLRLRASDRFWFENERNGIFTKDEISELRKITMWDIIVNSTDIGENDIQRQVFMWQKGDPCPQPMQLNASELEPCTYLKGYDYFSGSELTFIYAIVFLGFVPIVCAGAGYCVVKLQNSKRRKLKIRQEALKAPPHKGSVDKMVAR